MAMQILEGGEDVVDMTPVLAHDVDVAEYITADSARVVCASFQHFANKFATSTLREQRGVAIRKNLDDDNHSTNALLEMNVSRHDEVRTDQLYEHNFAYVQWNVLWSVF